MGFQKKKKMDQIKWLLSHTYNILCGLCAAFLGYFAPVNRVILVTIAAITLDLVIGVLAARYRGDGIKSKKLWRTIYKGVLSIAIIQLLYAIDKEMGMLELHKFAAWLIAGFEVWSILETASKTLDSKLFRILQNLMEDKVKKTTGIDIKKDETNK